MIRFMNLLADDDDAGAIHLIKTGVVDLRRSWPQPDGILELAISYDKVKVVEAFFEQDPKCLSVIKNGCALHSCRSVDMLLLLATHGEGMDVTAVDDKGLTAVEHHLGRRGYNKLMVAGMLCYFPAMPLPKEVPFLQKRMFLQPLMFRMAMCDRLPIDLARHFC
jgi:hypothetical protein